MTTWREISKVANDPAAARALAQRLLKVQDKDRTEWESEFLRSTASRPEDYTFNTRQAEKLLEIRDNGEYCSTTREGFSVASLIQQCWIARYDLSDDDTDFIVNLRDSGGTTIKRRHVGRLLRCCRELAILDPED
jgi:hypothetical protein